MSDAIEERIAKHLKMYEPDLSIHFNPIIKMSAQEKIQAIKAAPRDINKLIVEIAIKQKAFDNETRFPEREILRAELNGLEWMRYTIRNIQGHK